MAVNAEQAEYWGGEGGQKWVARETDYDRILQPFEAILLAGAGVSSAERVVDIGCGFGATTVAAARAATGGAAMGVDISAPMVELARRRAAEAGVSNVRFEQADAQTYLFGEGSFDVAMSRFGVMFFDNPVAAFANVARGVRAGGRLAFLCWQSLFDNDWMLVPSAAALQHVPMPEPGDPHAPGPFAFADADWVRAVLGDAGWSDISLDSRELRMHMPGDTPEASAEFMRETGMGRILFTDVEPDAVARAMAAVRDTLAERWSADGLYLGGKAWLVTATRP